MQRSMLRLPLGRRLRHGLQVLSGLPLNELPGHQPEYITSLSTENPSKTEIAQLKNGLRIASEDFRGHISSLCVLLDAGSRDYTDQHIGGVTHFLDRLAFKVGIAMHPGRGRWKPLLMHILWDVLNFFTRAQNRGKPES
jgi:predicted Zn-dependent peptidase